jgi:gliding motility-associated-like protein
MHFFLQPFLIASWARPLFFVLQKRHVGVLLSALFSFQTFAQIVDNQCSNVAGVTTGAMKLSATAGCVPLRVVAQNTQTGSSNSRYIFEYKGGSPTTYMSAKDSAFTFSKVGIYTVMQLSEASDGRPQRTCLTVTVQDTLPPFFQLAHCGNGKVRLGLPTHPNNRYDEYVVEWGDGNAAILNRLTTSYNYQYRDMTPRTVIVRGLHRVGGCGGRSKKTIAFEANARPATISKLEIIDPITAELTIENPNAIPLELFRQDGGGAFQTTGKTLTNATEKVKVLVDTNRLYCYKLKPLDVCLSEQESNTICTAFVRVIPEDEANTIVITPYLYLTDVKQSSVTRDGRTWWTPGKTDLFRLDKEAPCGRKSCYRLTIETNGGTVLSNTYCADPPIALCTSISNVYVAEAFTPNGDGINDVFEIKSENVTAPEMLVFDRWGKVVFQNSPNVVHWNGNIDGAPAPVGPYFYRIQLIDKVGRRFVKRGIVSLVR